MGDGAPQRRIDAAARAAFVAGLREGLCREDSAAAAGFSLTGFYGARRRDPAFAAEWTAALDRPPAAERRARAYAERGEVRIAPANRRRLQRRRRRHVRFTAGRRELYVTCLAGSCDSVAAAEAAGIHPSTARLHRRMDPVFDAACREALDQGAVLLEAELVRLRLEARKRLSAAIDRAGPFPSRALLAEEGAECDRCMKLLARYDRERRRPDSRLSPGGRRRAMTFEESLALLDRKLRNLDIPFVPPPEGRNGEGKEGPEEDSASPSPPN